MKTFKDKKNIRRDEADDGDSWLVSYADMMTLIACFFILMMAFANYDPAGFTKKAEELSKSFNKDKYKSSELKMSEITEEVSKQQELNNNIKVTNMDGHIAITFSSSILFERGSADISQEAQNSLDLIVDIIKSKPKNYRIIIEGHSNSVEHHDSEVYSSSWELSAIRSSRVLLRFEQLGFSPKRLACLSKGDSEPLVPFANDEGELIEENLEQNSRVIIKVLEPLNDSKKIKFGFGIYFNE